VDPAEPRPGASLFTERTPRVAAARKLTRRAGRDATGRFLAEGAQAVREALHRPGTVIELFGTPAALAQRADLTAVATAAGVPTSAVTDRGMATLSETVTPQGLLAVCHHLDVPLAAVLPAAVLPAAVLPAAGDLLAAPSAAESMSRPHGPASRAARPWLGAVLAAIRDPGNAGTVLRTADAVGADAVLFGSASVDPYNGKCVRSGAGSHFHLPLVRGGDPAAYVEALRAAGVRVLAATGSGEVDLDELTADGTLSGPVAWLFGNEARGLPASLAALADARVRIPMYGRAESLNLAAAATICLYVTAQAQRVRA
jgi:RNA methyltransferase, TrmH family